MMDLHDRTVLITGAARGIGAHLAAELVRRGANVALVGLEPQELTARAAELGERCAPFEADVRDQAALEAAVAGTVERFGGIDVVVANAGVASIGTVRTTDPDAFALTIDVNLTGVFRTVRAALPPVIARRGHVLVISSVSALAPLAGMAAYSASKAGAENFTTALAGEVAHLGVTVGAAHPSWIDTDMVRDAEDDLASFRELRGRLPWPANSTTTVEECARRMADGIQKRRAKVYVPPEAQVLYWVRALVNSPLAQRVGHLMTKRIVPRMEQEVEALGRSTSARVAEQDRRTGDRS